MPSHEVPTHNVPDYELAVIRPADQPSRVLGVAEQAPRGGDQRTQLSTLVLRGRLDVRDQSERGIAARTVGRSRCLGVDGVVG